MTKTTLIFLTSCIALLLVGWYLLMTGPRAQEPTQDPYVGWSEREHDGLVFKYPDPFHKTYISAQNWPPIVERVVHENSCMTEATLSDGPVPHLEEKVINGTKYCIATASEGAAGSTYITYEYTKAGVRALFTLRFPQCLNYDEPEQGACALEQQTFDVDTLADRILSSVR